MRLVLSRLFIAALLTATTHLQAQQAPETFRWVDFHSAKDQDVVAWVTRSLVPEKWTAIREIGIQYDAALVVTTLRATPQSPVAQDTFTVWSLSLTSHVVAPIITGVNLRLLDWMLLADSAPRELGALYDDCYACEPETFITAFHYDMPHHMWAARWLRGTQTVPLWNANPPAGVGLTQVYAVLAEPNGRQLIGTWSHFDFGDQKPPADSIYRYDLDPYSGLERTQLLNGKEADSMKQRLCSAQNPVPGLERGQDSTLCQQMIKPRTERKPVTTPPANNHGQSVPPGARH
ncbi:MAG: hypothetical protein ABSF70_04500 [Terracidiphilus sp.]|jgi:hypothetical protein